MDPNLYNRGAPFRVVRWSGSHIFNLGDIVYFKRVTRSQRIGEGFFYRRRDGAVQIVPFRDVEPCAPE